MLFGQLVPTQSQTWLQLQLKFTRIKSLFKILYGINWDVFAKFVYFGLKKLCFFLTPLNSFVFCRNMF